MLDNRKKLQLSLAKRGYMNEDLINEIEQIYSKQQLPIHGVSKCINEKLVDWLCEDYTREEAIDQIETATIKEERVFTVTYDNGKYDKVVLENNIIKIHEPR